MKLHSKRVEKMIKGVKIFDLRYPVPTSSHSIISKEENIVSVKFQLANTEKLRESLDKFDECPIFSNAREK